jgi:aminoglycoside 3-N-acetyltransferase I
MPNSYQIKTLSSADLQLAKALFLSFQEEDSIKEPKLPSDAYVNRLLAKDDFHIIVAIAEDGKVIGGLTAYELAMYMEETSEMFLYEIGVDAVHQRKGIARELVESLKQICADRGIKYMYVGTETHNIPAVNLYEITGGVPDKYIAWFVWEMEE